MALRIKRDGNEMKILDLIHVIHLFTCLVVHVVFIFNISHAGIHGVPQAYLYAAGWVIQNFGTPGHGCGLPEPVSVQIPRPKRAAAA